MLASWTLIILLSSVVIIQTIQVYSFLNKYVKIVCQSLNFGPILAQDLKIAAGIELTNCLKLKI
jgi:hypothetical protein